MKKKAKPKKAKAKPTAVETIVKKEKKEEEIVKWEEKPKKEKEFIKKPEIKPERKIKKPQTGKGLLRIFRRKSV